MWSHHVTSLDESVSLSVWSPFAAAEIAGKIVEEMPLPISKRWQYRERVAALRVLFGSIVARLNITMGLGEFISWTLLDSRYHAIGSVVDHQGQAFSEFCWDREIEDAVLEDSRELLAAYIRKVGELMDYCARLGGDERRDIELANYFELAANAIVGPAKVKQLLYDFAWC